MPAPISLMATWSERRALLDAERAARPFVIYRDDRDRLRLTALPDDGSEVIIGRRPQSGIPLPWDREVSREHAVLSRIGGAWTVIDDGLSSNGTAVNGEPLGGRRRLRDGDVIGCGGVEIGFCDPSSRAPDETAKAPPREPQVRLSPAQRRVLVALCRPLDASPYAIPATNKEIAEELSLSVDAVKTHLRRIAELLGVHDVPQNRKRAQLAERALMAGILTGRDFRER